MANFADAAAGRVVAADLIKTRMAAGDWIEGFVCITKDGHTAVRFIRPMAPTDATTKGYGAWTESRADDEA